MQEITLPYKVAKVTKPYRKNIRLLYGFLFAQQIVGRICFWNRSYIERKRKWKDAIRSIII